MRHALFVAFHFPPEASSSGVLRTLKFVRYLEHYGWRVTVIAPEVDAYDITDREPETQIPRSCRVVRTRYLNTKRHLALFGRYPALLAVPDVWIGWVPWAVAASRRIHNTDPFEVVYSTSPHASAHLIGRRVARISGRPWVADFRDPWVEDPPEPGAPDGLLFRSINRTLERGVIESCHAAVASTSALCRMLQQRYPHAPREKFHTIVNGFDEADFQHIDAAIGDRGGQMLIVHAGMLNAEFRDPRPLFRALRRCSDARRIDLTKVRVRLIGGGVFAESPELHHEIKRLELDDVVRIEARVPYAQSLQQLAAADLLLLIQASADTSSLVPAKLYEYLRMQRPVLALVQHGASADVVETTRGGWVVSPDDDEGLDDRLTEAYNRWGSGTLFDVKADLNVLSRFERKLLTAKLAKLFDGLLGC